jgi:arylsulfatase A-like enzyme
MHGPMWWILLAACGGDGRPSAVSSAEAGPTLALSVDVPFAELEIPEQNRPLGRAPSEDVPVLGDWVLAEADSSRKVYEAPLPVRPRALFYMRPPTGMALLGKDGEELAYGQARKRGWFTSATRLTVAVDPSAPPPGPADFKVRYPLAAERESALNYAFAAATSKETFVRTRVQAGPASLAGLLLPAPGVAAWDVTVPAAGELRFSPGLVAPETLDAAPSDGVTFSVEIEADGVVKPVWTASIAEPTFDPVRVDLSAWAGQQVRLRFRTDPGATPTFDYAFWADPILASRKSDPKRVVMIFVDTMRRDHLGVYGYDRATSASLDRFAQDAVVFDDARSVAPWTLPSARSVITGRQPELYDVSETLQSKLRSEGWSTAMFAGNVYLSANFDMERGWGLHHVVNWPLAEPQVDLAVDWLAEQDGHDAMLLLHLMDPHLPYDEPAAYRYLFAAAERPARLPDDEFERPTLLRAGLTKPADRQWVIDRYDNNVAYAHDELQRLFSQLTGEEVVVYFADHGEELWDHGDFEHGHTLYDELLRIPLVVKAPGLAPGRVAEPASLLDVTPTVLDALGLPWTGLDGTSLLPAARGDAAAKAALADRPVAFGRPLYGAERWGVLDDGVKYVTTEGKEHAYELASDVKENRDKLEGKGIAESAEWRAALGEALGREVSVGFRLSCGGRGVPTEDIVVEMTVPGGVAAAWVGEDPTNKSSAAVDVDGERVTARWHAGYGGSREIYVMPASPLAEVTHRVEVRLPGEAGTIVVPETRSAEPDGNRAPLGRVKLPNGRAVALTWAIAPVPAADAEPISGADDELMEALKAMGYAVGDDDNEPKKP